MDKSGWILSLASILLLSSCASSSPPSRLSQYVGPLSASELSEATLPSLRPIRAALVVLSDNTAPEAAPVLPSEAQARLAETLREQVNRGYPLMIERVVPTEDFPAESSKPDWTALAARYGVDYLLVTVLSSTEQEYPITLFLGWTTHSQPGYRRDNWALAEAALIEGRSGRVILAAEGRAWATLDRPTAPGISQWYPVIYLRPQDPERRIWPPTYEGAPITLRLVAMQNAAARLAMNLQRAWIRQRDQDLAAATP